MTLIEAKGLTKQFVIDRSWLGRPKKVLTAVNRVSLTIETGETVGLLANRAAASRPLPAPYWACILKPMGIFFIKAVISASLRSVRTIDARCR